MQGYDKEAAVEFIAGSMRKAGLRYPEEELRDFIRRAIDEDIRYMHECGALDAEGLMGEGEYDEDDAFEVIMERMTDNVDDEDEFDRLAVLLNGFMEAQQDYLTVNGLTEAF